MNVIRVMIAMEMLHVPITLAHTLAHVMTDTADQDKHAQILMNVMIILAIQMRIVRIYRAATNAHVLMDILVMA